MPVYVLDVDLASIPGASTPSREVWELAMRASAAWSSHTSECMLAPDHSAISDQRTAADGP
jgi:hypothetical protein